MKNFFNNLSLTKKLLVVGLIPLSFLVYFATLVAIEKNERIEVVENLISEVNTSVAIMNVAHQFHLERRLSLDYTLRKGTETRLAVQRAQTDRQIAALANVKLPISLSELKKATLLNNLSTKRRQILNRELGPEEIITFYTGVLSRLQSFSVASGQHLPYLETLNQDLVGQQLVFQIANYLGLVRAEVYYTLTAKSHTDQEYNTIINTKNLLDSYRNEFAAKLSELPAQQLQKALNTEDAKYVNAILNKIAASGKIDFTEDPDTWWRRSERVVDDLLSLQYNLLNKIGDDAETIYREETIYRNIFLTGLFLVIIFALFIISYILANISESLQKLKKAAEALALGKIGIDPEIHSKDAIGKLAEAIKSIDRNNQSLSEAAEAIGKGDFHVPVIPRSEHDVLGHAIAEMKDDLQEFAKENEDKIWTQAGVALINNGLQGEKNLESLTKDVLNAIVSYAETETGVFYVSNSNNELEFYAGRAITNTKSIPKKISPGETLIGQAALDKEIIHLENVPDEFLRISTASGSTLPKNLIIIPLIHNDYVEGVIELGSIKPICPLAMELLRESTRNIAISLHTAKSRLKLQQPLEDTQTQAEELLTQHGELENLNSELEAQTQKLQSSEEELKVQQEELLQANQELEERTRMLEEKNQVIVERNLEIQKKAEDLEISTKYKSEFLANMSHELRTPLNSILLLSRLITENHEKNLTSEQIEYAQVIHSSGNGLLTLIDEILDLSKIESGKMDLEYSDTSISEIVYELNSLFTPIAREKKLELIFDVQSKTPSLITTDKLRLGQILKNLISNALKFTHKGSIKLEISVPENKESCIRFSVKDTGIGIPQEKQGQIFEAFQQADGSTRRKYGGTGLGLSISKELVKLLGGDIKLKSVPGEGSEFTVVIPQMPELPVDKYDARSGNDFYPEITETAKIGSEVPERLIVKNIPKEIADDRDAVNKGDRVILIIEDDTLFAKALLSYSRKKGYKGLVAVRGDVGIEMAHRYKPAAILLDIQLPVKDGWQVMEELKSNSATRHIPVHIMSSTEAKKKSLSKGAVDFINKPIAMEQMQTIFRKLEDALSRNPKKVLIVEENPKHAKALAFFLESFQVVSEITGNIKDGVTALQKKDVDCVILDMGIPDQNAYETLETVKANPGLEDLPIIIFTGKTISPSEEAKLRQYADSIVIKTAHSYQRILDEVGLFLHLVEEKSSDRVNGNARKLGKVRDVLKDKTVLIADDDVRNIFSLTKALEQLNVKVVSAVDGKEALRQLEENPDIDAVLMDMMMPELDGYETTSLIRKNPRYKNLPILAVTAKAMIGDRDKCIQAGASDYISKPVDIDQLISLLKVWLYDRGL